MRMLLIGGSLLCTSYLACDSSSSHPVGATTNDPLTETIETQTARYDAQLEKTDEQLARLDLQQDRYDAILAKWEEQTGRLDRLMDESEQLLGRMITLTQDRSAPASPD